MVRYTTCGRERRVNVNPRRRVLPARLLSTEYLDYGATGHGKQYRVPRPSHAPSYYRSFGRLGERQALERLCALASSLYSSIESDAPVRGEQSLFFDILLEVSLAQLIRVKKYDRVL